jgi:hypothetical protein
MEGPIYTFADFSGRVGMPCEVEVAGHCVTLTLDAAQEIPGGPREGGSFRLEFLGPHSPMLGQGTFSFRYGDQGFDLFIVPIGSDAQGVRYEALFF